MLHPGASSTPAPAASEPQLCALPAVHLRALTALAHLHQPLTLQEAEAVLAASLELSAADNPWRRRCTNPLYRRTTDDTDLISHWNAGDIAQGTHLHASPALGAVASGGTLQAPPRSPQAPAEQLACLPTALPSRPTAGGAAPTAGGDGRELLRRFLSLGLVTALEPPTGARSCASPGCRLSPAKAAEVEAYGDSVEAAAQFSLAPCSCGGVGCRGLCHFLREHASSSDSDCSDRGDSDAASGASSPAKAPAEAPAEAPAAVSLTAPRDAHMVVVAFAAVAALLGRRRRDCGGSDGDSSVMVHSASDGRESRASASGGGAAGPSEQPTADGVVHSVASAVEQGAAAAHAGVGDAVTVASACTVEACGFAASAAAAEEVAGAEALHVQRAIQLAMQRLAAHTARPHGDVTAAGHCTDHGGSAILGAGRETGADVQGGEADACSIASLPGLTEQQAEAEWQALTAGLLAGSRGVADGAPQGCGAEAQTDSRHDAMAHNPDVRAASGEYALQGEHRGCPASPTSRGASSPPDDCGTQLASWLAGELDAVECLMARAAELVPHTAAWWTTAMLLLAPMRTPPPPPFGAHALLSGAPPTAALAAAPEVEAAPEAAEPETESLPAGTSLSVMRPPVASLGCVATEAAPAALCVTGLAVGDGGGSASVAAAPAACHGATCGGAACGARTLLRAAAARAQAALSATRAAERATSHAVPPQCAVANGPVCRELRLSVSAHAADGASGHSPRQTAGGATQDGGAAALRTPMSVHLRILACLAHLRSAALALACLDTQGALAAAAEAEALLEETPSEWPGAAAVAEVTPGPWDSTGTSGMCLLDATAGEGAHVGGSCHCLVCTSPLTPPLVALAAEAAALQGAAREAREHLYGAVRQYDRALRLLQPEGAAHPDPACPAVLLLRAALAAARARSSVRLASLTPFATAPSAAAARAGSAAIGTGTAGAAADPRHPHPGAAAQAYGRTPNGTPAARSTSAASGSTTSNVAPANRTAPPVVACWDSPLAVPWFALEGEREEGQRPTLPIRRASAAGRGTRPRGREQGPRAASGPPPPASLPPPPLAPACCRPPCPRVAAAAAGALAPLASAYRALREVLPPNAASTAGDTAAGATGDTDAAASVDAAAAPPCRQACVAVVAAEVGLTLAWLQLLAASAAAPPPGPAQPPSSPPSRIACGKDRQRLLRRAGAASADAYHWLQQALQCGTADTQCCPARDYGLEGRCADAALLAAACAAGMARPFRLQEGGHGSGATEAAAEAAARWSGCCAAEDVAEWERAWEWGKTALRLRQKSHAVDSEACLEVQAFLAHVAGAGLGLWTAAEPLLASVVSLRAQALGPRHPATQAAALGLVDLLLAHNRFRTADGALTRLLPRELSGQLRRQARQEEMRQQREQQLQRQQQQQQQGRRQRQVGGVAAPRRPPGKASFGAGAGTGAFAGAGSDTGADRASAQRLLELRMQLRAARREALAKAEAAGMPAAVPVVARAPARHVMLPGLLPVCSAPPSQAGRAQADAPGLRAPGSRTLPPTSSPPADPDVPAHVDAQSVGTAPGQGGASPIAGAARLGVEGGCVGCAGPSMCAAANAAVPVAQHAAHDVRPAAGAACTACPLAFHRMHSAGGVRLRWERGAGPGLCGRTHEWHCCAGARVGRQGASGVSRHSGHSEGFGSAGAVSLAAVNSARTVLGTGLEAPVDMQGEESAGAVGRETDQ